MEVKKVMIFLLILFAPAGYCLITQDLQSSSSNVEVPSISSVRKGDIQEPFGYVELQEPTITKAEKLPDEQVVEKVIEEDITPSFTTGVRGLFELQDELESMISYFPGWYSIYVKNLDTNEYLSINNEQRHPASLLKLFNMAYVFATVESGQMTKTPQIEHWNQMQIVVSCNDSYNHLLVVLGDGDAVLGARRTTDFIHRQGYLETVVGGTLHPSSFDERLAFASYVTTVRDVGHLLEDIYRGTLVSPEASAEMLAILKAQERLNKIPAGLPYGTISASKTGEVFSYEHDAAIVFSEGANYIIVIMSSEDYAAIANIIWLSRVVYQYFN